MYNTRISKWGLNKRIRDNEYESILKKKRKREDENPGRASKFILHEKLVPEDKIARFQKRKGRDLGDTFTYNDAGRITLFREIVSHCSWLTPSQQHLLA